MSELWQELMIDWPNTTELLRVLLRLVVAGAVGAIPGMQRERVGMAAGLRTHTLVSLGSALFVLTAINSGASPDAVTRVLQGIATGIGFVGAGAIVKATELKQVHGLTTASSIWMTAALGAAAGSGRLGLAVLGSVLALVVLSVLHRFESHVMESTSRH
jgi:putative Mg2+ transporter-C (MgtC) family protein